MSELKNKINFTVACVDEFAQKNNLSVKEACSKACYEHVFQIDQHLPFTTPKVQKLVETIKPEYLTHELMSYGRSEHEIKLVMQRAALKGENL